MSEYNKTEQGREFFERAAGVKPAKKKVVRKKNELPTFKVGADFKRHLGAYDAPICGYLAKVAMPQAQCEEYEYPFGEGDTVLVFGDISMMPGHCVFATKDGKVHFGYHTDNFRPLTEDEI